MIDQVLDLSRRVIELERAEAGIVGTFTPAFTGTGTAGTFTYVAGRQDGSYLRIGNVVLFALEVNISAISVAPTGNMTISGLPFTAGGNQDGSVSFGLIANLDFSANCVQLTGLIVSGTAVIDLREVFDNAGSTAYPAANFTNANAQLRLTGMYWTA
jgi:hypothetical protein